MDTNNAAPEGSGAAGTLRTLTTTETELLREVICGLRSIRFGSVVMTVHDGRVVEIQKIERIRKPDRRSDSENPK